VLIAIPEKVISQFMPYNAKETLPKNECHEYRSLISMIMYNIFIISADTSQPAILQKGTAPASAKLNNSNPLGFHTKPAS
jgi:hypothetical protein